MATQAPAPVRFFTYKPLPPQACLADPDNVRHNIIKYFSGTLPQGTETIAKGGNHPTPEGLSRALGLSGWSALKNVIIDATLPPAQQDQPHRPDQPPVIPMISVDYILSACSDMQDYYLKHSLSSGLNSSVTKFIASAYFNINETKVSSSSNSNTNLTKEDQTITIRVENADPSGKAEVIEMNRLESALASQTERDREAGGLTPAAPAPAPAPEDITVEDLL